MTHATIQTPDLGSGDNRYGPAAARPAPGETRRLSSRTVDIHAHVNIPAAWDYMTPHFDASKIAMVRHSTDETRAINMAQTKDRTATMTDRDDRMRVLDAMGIDLQVVAPIPFQCWYQSPPEHCIKGSQIVNDGIAEWVGGNDPLEDHVASRSSDLSGRVRRHAPYPEPSAVKGTRPGRPGPRR